MLVVKGVMNWHSSQLPSEALRFLGERHLATLSIPRQGRSPHVTPVGFTWDDSTATARVITFADAQKVKLVQKAESAMVALCQVDGGRWLAMEGRAEVHSDEERCAEGIRRYAERYRPPKDRGADRRVIEISVQRVSGRV